jgi:hypothetical protein
VAGGSEPGTLSQDPKTFSRCIWRRSGGLRAGLLGIVALAVVFLWIKPAHALPSFAGQTGLPCSACHVGAFGPQLTSFGMHFKATGYTMGGGTGPWAHIPFDVQFSPTFTSLATSRAKPVAPPALGTNNFYTPGCAPVFLAAGGAFDGGFGVGGILKVWNNLNNAFSITTGGVASMGPSDIKLTQPVKLGGNNSLLLGLDFNNRPTEGDPYNTLYGYAFPYISGSDTTTPSAAPMISKLGNSVNGLTLYAFANNAIYVQGGVYSTTATSVLEAFGKSAPSVGTITGGAPYFRVAWQHSWGPNFLEVGGVFLDTTLDQIPGIANPSLQNEFVDLGVDLTYQCTVGNGLIAIATNVLHEQQTLGASFASGKSSNATDDLDQFRVASSYYWNNTYGFTLAYNITWGTQDPLLYRPAPLSGSANGLPNSQAVVAQVDWTPFGKSTTESGYPWLNMRFGLQYTWYLEVNGGTANYDGFGRSASANDSFLAFAWFSF